MQQIKASSELELDLTTSSFEVRAQRMRAVFLSTDDLAQAAARRVQIRRKKRALVQMRRPSRPILYVVLGLLISGGALAWNQAGITDWLDRMDAEIAAPSPRPRAGATPANPISSTQAEQTPQEQRQAVDVHRERARKAPSPALSIRGGGQTSLPSSKGGPTAARSEADAWQRVAHALGQDDLEQAQAETDRLRASANRVTREAAILLAAQLEKQAEGHVSAQTRQELTALRRRGSSEHIRREATRLLGE